MNGRCLNIISAVAEHSEQPLIIAKDERRARHLSARQLPEAPHLPSGSDLLPPPELSLHRPFLSKLSQVSLFVVFFFSSLCSVSLSR